MLLELVPISRSNSRRKSILNADKIQNNIDLTTKYTARASVQHCYDVTVLIIIVYPTKFEPFKFFLDIVNIIKPEDRYV